MQLNLHSSLKTSPRYFSYFFTISIFNTIGCKRWLHFWQGFLIVFVFFNFVWLHFLAGFSNFSIIFCRFSDVWFFYWIFFQFSFFHFFVYKLQAEFSKSLSRNLAVFYIGRTTRLGYDRGYEYFENCAKSQNKKIIINNIKNPPCKNRSERVSRKCLIWKLKTNNEKWSSYSSISERTQKIGMV